MTSEEKQRMIHIRINNLVHRELRKVAAENDQTMQELVAEAVENKVEAREAELRIEEIQLELEERALKVEEQALEMADRAMEIELRSRELESREIELEIAVDMKEESGISGKKAVNRIIRMEKLLSTLSIQLSALKGELLDEE